MKLSLSPGFSGLLASALLLFLPFQSSGAEAPRRGVSAAQKQSVKPSQQKQQRTSNPAKPTSTLSTASAKTTDSQHPSGLTPEQRMVPEDYPADDDDEPLEIELLSSVVMFREPNFNIGKNISCPRLPKGTRGHVMAETPTAYLLVFEESVWDENCPQGSGIADLPSAWVKKGPVLKVVNPREPKLPPSPPPAPVQPKEEIKKGEAATDAVPGTCDRCTPESPVAKNSPTFEIPKLTPHIRCGGGHDIDQLVECGFSNILKRARKESPKKNEPCEEGKDKKICACERRLKEEACTHSPWKNLTLDERFQQVLSKTGYYVNRPEYQERGLKIDPRAMACISARESRVLEPLAHSAKACGRKEGKYETSTARGMLQLVRPSFNHIMVKYFKGLTPPFNNDFYSDSKNRPKLYEAMALNVDLQAELFVALMEWKANVARGFDAVAKAKEDYNVTIAPMTEEEETFYFYYGGHPKASQEYSRKITACLKCLRERVNKDGSRQGVKKPSEDPINCLSLSYDKMPNGKQPDARSEFDHYRLMCPVDVADAGEKK